MKKTGITPTSAAQVEANRANARRSTGPRSAEGRAASRLNALKHGLLAETLLVRCRNLEENDEEFAALYKQFRQELQPVGAVELMLVEEIVSTHWRLRRVLAAEAGEIALSVDGGKWARSRVAEKDMERLAWQMAPDAVERMKESSLGTGALEVVVMRLRTQVADAGELTEAMCAEVDKRLGGLDTRLTKRLRTLRAELEQNPEGLEAEALRARNLESVLGYLDKEQGILAWQTEQCAEREEREEEARLSASRLPALAVTERILRYETKLQKQLYRAMAQLERLQRIRQGEKVPAPVCIV